MLSLLSLGCGDAERKPPDAKPVVPVSGVVHVDGVAKAGVRIVFHAKVQDPKNATQSVATTDAEGKFKAWTYQIDDGVPPGDYTLTFNDQSEAKPHLRDNPDLLNGKYSDPVKSEFELTVPESGGPVDMGTLELTR
ncbi:MAG: carboxypeptidase-like regulatory domain-containing protein [Planctomycetaceae bacterium]